jgi:hypothetical protein
MPNNESIHYIDFSKNNKVVLVKFMSGKIIAQELVSLQNYSQELIPFTEWTNQAQNMYDLNCKMKANILNLLSSHSNLYEEEKSPLESSIILIR